jgi:nucleoside-triphosphatase
LFRRQFLILTPSVFCDGYEKKFKNILPLWFQQVTNVKRVLLITGTPGIGKTTTLIRAVDMLKGRGYKVGGMISREVREAGTRNGFEIIDLSSGKRGWLAHVNQKTGPSVGKYRVNLQDLNSIGVHAIMEATESCHVVAIDEIGPMELFSEKFKEAVQKALESPKPVIAVVHWKAQDRLLNEMKNMKNVETFTVTTENRDQLSQTLAEKAVQSLLPS